MLRLAAGPTGIELVLRSRWEVSASLARAPLRILRLPAGRLAQAPLQSPRCSVKRLAQAPHRIPGLRLGLHGPPWLHKLEAGVSRGGEDGLVALQMADGWMRISWLAE